MDIDKSSPRRESLANGEVFLWHAHSWLTAHKAVEIHLPSDLIRDSEAIGSIIESPSPDVQLGFHVTKWRKRLKGISIKLPAFCSVRLNRSSEAILKTDSPFPVSVEFSEVSS